MFMGWNQLRVFERKWLWLWLPPVSTLILILLLGSLLSLSFGTTLWISGLIGDWVAGTLLAYWMYALLRPWWVFLVLQTLVMGTLYVANGFKIYFFSVPVRPTDFQDIPVLLDQVNGWRFLVMATPLLAAVLVFLAGLRWRWRTVPILFGGILLVALPLWAAPKVVSRSLDMTFGYLPFGDIRNFNWRGPLLYLYNEKARELASVTPAPTQAEVMAAIEHTNLPRPLPPISSIARRDIYIFMMETFWDPSVLSAAHYTHDPLAPAFRSLWEQAGESKAMVPVFGNGTPNSEFEVLCGEPAYSGEIMVFMTVMDRPMMCLPRVLARLGYHTTALTADSYGTWNRGAAFQYAGFERFYSSKNLSVTDRNGQFISDAQLFDETDEFMAHDGLSPPRLMYISTDSGHFPYQMAESRRPPVIHSDARNHLVQDYANAVYYDSGELADYIGRIRARDPDALIVAFGDHLPILGSGLAIMVKSHLTAHQETQFKPKMFVIHQSTPLLIIDGRHGPLKLGHVSLFEVPRLLMKLLGAPGPTEFDAFAPPPGLHIRPYYEHLIVLADDGTVQACTPARKTPSCDLAARWDADMQTLRDDILSGHDFAETLFYGSDPHRFDLPGNGSIPYVSPVKAGASPDGH